MPRAFNIHVAFAAFVALIAPGSAAVDAGTTVAGVVVNAKGDPVPEVEVSIVELLGVRRLVGPAVVSGVTDAAGNFEFRGLHLLGAYQINAIEQQSALTAWIEREFGAADAGTTVRVRLQLSERFAIAHGVPTPAPYTTVRVHYATDRQRGTGDDPQKFYLNQRSVPYKLQYGYAEVSIPESHTRGHIETFGVGDYLRLEFKPDPSRHIILEKVAESDAAGFFRDVKTDAAQRKSREIVVYVHGYLYSFERAVRVAAQIKYDLLPVDVAIVLYSWPSHNSLLGYRADTVDNDATVALLANFLAQLAQKNQTSKVSVIAHSLGNRALFAALQRLAVRKDVRKPALDQVVMAAPDVPSAEVLAKSCKVAAVARGFTLYASSHDQALLAAMEISRQARAGLAKPLLLAAGIDTIDASGAVTDFLGHSYFSNNTDILSDIEDVLTGHKPPRAHLVEAVSKASWQFVANPSRNLTVGRLAKAKHC
jgi:esterase/lipase superfamily enzyme